MPRKRIIRSHDLPYHISNRSVDKTFYPPSHMKNIWNLAADLLKVCTWAYGARIHAFVLMSNHYHLILSTPDSNLDTVMQYFQSKFSLALSTYFKAQKLCFGTRYKWTLIEDPKYYVNAYRYVFQNPLRAGLSLKIENYPWSSASGIYGMSRHEVPIYPQAAFQNFLPDFENLSELSWLNTHLGENDLNAIRKGLAKSVFKVAKRQKDLKL